MYKTASNSALALALLSAALSISACPQPTPHPTVLRPRNPIPSRPEPPRVRSARRFLARRGITPQSPIHKAVRHIAAPSRTAPESSTPTWTPAGPLTVLTPAYGPVSGRVAALALDPSDPTGNHVYLATTGGGLWRSQNAAASAPASVQFLPLTDNLGALTAIPQSGISVGAVSVQPGSTGVLLAGLGDPNDALDSYYGAGILRSTDNGQTWTLIQHSLDYESSLSPQDYWFLGEGFAGFAWSTSNIQTVVAAVSQAYEATLVHAGLPNLSYEGLYYSQDSGATWHLSQISDPGGFDVQGPQDAFAGPDGNAATSVIWNPVRQLFLAAIRYHGYYQSPDGVTWTRLASQPGIGLTTGNCPTQPGQPGVAGCPLFRGALAVNPSTGDTFAWSIDEFNQDQGIWQDVCNLAGSTCANPTLAFTAQLNSAALEISDINGAATIPNGDYNLTLAAIPGGLGSGQDTLVFAGANDLYKCSLANSCQWRNTTNTAACSSAAVAPYQHALAWSLGNPLLLYLGNDSGLWRSTDQVGESGAVCSSSDASHFQNLNPSLASSLTEVESLAQSSATSATMLAGLGANGSAAIVSNPTTPVGWNQVLDGEGGPVVIDHSSSVNSWYVNNAAGVSISHCSSTTACTPALFTPVIGETQVQNDGLTMDFPAPFLKDALDNSQLLVATCRLWRGPTSGTGWTTANAISPILDGAGGAACNGDALIRSLAVQSITGSTSGAEILYLGMAGAGDDGGIVPGHVFSATLLSGATTQPVWTDLSLSPVLNTAAAFNPAGEDVSSLVIDPHDTTGSTVYATISGFASTFLPTQSVYQSIDAGAHWTAITSNLPNAPANALAIDPQDANTVYIATDVGVYITRAVFTCGTATNCWTLYGAGLPESPVTQLIATPTGASGPFAGQALTAGTYGRGIWQIPLVTAGTTLTTAIVAPTSLTFAGQTVGTPSAAQTLTLKTTGSNPLTVTSVNFSGFASADFSQTTTCLTGPIVKNATCTIKITFTPTASGSRTASLVITANLPGGQLLVPLAATGLGTAGIALQPAGLNFGNVQTATSAPTQNISIQNIGGSPVSLSSITVTAPFVKSSSTCSGSLAANAACAVTIGFTPTQAIAYTGSLTVLDSAGTQSAQLTGAGIAGPTDTLSTAGLSFPGTVVGQTSSALPVTITNSGGLPLTGIGTSVTGNFSAVDTCGSTLAAASSCAVNVTFLPASTGSLSGTLTISDALRSQVVHLAGTGLKPPLLVITVSSVNFGTQQINLPSTSHTITIENIGGSPLSQPTFALIGAGAPSFQIGASSCGATVAANTSCTLALTFLPLSVGAASATLTVSTATPGVASATVSLAGTGLSPPALSVNPAQLNLGTVIVGNAGAIFTVQITNTGQVALVGPTFSITGNTDFALITPTDITACSGTLNPANTCNIQVQFSPSALGTESATLTVSSSNAIPSTATVSLTATGAAAITLQANPLQLSFPPTPAGTSSTAETLSVSNLGRKQANGLTLTVAGPYQLAPALTTCKSILAGLTSCTVGLVFTPGVAGDQPGSLTAQVTNLGTAPLVVPLDGTGVAVGGLTVSPTQMTFGSIVLNTPSAAQSFTVTNSGQGSVTGLALAISGDFSLLQNVCPAVLPPASSCTASVVFTPTALGNRTASIAVTNSSAGVLPASIALTGNGIAAGGLTALPTVVSFGSLTIGLTSPAQTVTVTNASGPGASTLTGLAFSVAGDFSLAQNSCGTQIAPGAACSYSVSFTPTLPGTRIGSITVKSANGPSVVTGLSGTGLPTAQLSVSPTQLNFGQVPVGANSPSLQLTVHNPGSGTLAGLLFQTSTPFSVGSGTCRTTLAAGQSCTVPVTYAPTAGTTQNGTMLISSTSLGVPSVPVPLVGVGILPASLTVKPTSLNFPAATVGLSSAAQSITVSNPGSLPLSGLALAITGDLSPDFAIGASSCTTTLAAGAACSTLVTFAPKSAGGHTAFFTASSTTSNVASANTALTGTGLTPASLRLTPTQLTFPATLLNQSSPTQQLALANSGQSGITDLHITLTAGFALDSAHSTCTAQLPAASTCSLGIHFTPTTGGPVTGTLTASSPASSSLGTSPATAAFSGTGAYPPGLVTSPAALIAFPTTAIHMSAAAIPVTVTNASVLTPLTGLSLAIDSVGNSNGFALSGNTCTASLAPAAKCTVNVLFAPTLPGKLSGTLRLSSTNGGSPLQLALTGIGFDFQLAVQGNSTGTVIAGQSAAYSLAVSPIAGTIPSTIPSGTFSFQCTALPANALCIFNPTQLPGLPANGTGNVSVSVSTASAKTAAMQRTRRVALLVCAFLFFPLLRRRALRTLSILLLAIFSLASLTSCASAGGSIGLTQKNGGTPPGTYTLQVSATSTGITHTLSLKLNVN